MLDQLHVALGDVVHTIEVVDIDCVGNEEFLEVYDELVPVLMVSREGGPRQKLCHYFLDLPALHLFLNESKEVFQHGTK